jgi:thioredoxin reductase (NADPH)
VSHASYDCLIIGGGPAGLTAAIYLGRFRRRVLVVDDGHSRAKWIPVSHNHARFPGGISGEELVQRMSDQAMRYGAHVQLGRIASALPDGNEFVATGCDAPIRARSLILATGVENRRPALDSEVHEAALANGTLRYCPICDGYEVIDKKVAVLGADGHGVDEALFLKTYTDDVTLVAVETVDLSTRERDKLSKAGIAIAGNPLEKLDFKNGKVKMSFREGGRPRLFDTVYPALGSDSHNEIAIALGLKLSDCGCIIVDDKQRTSLKKVYAAGDIVFDLDQISVATGHAAVAATTLHNDLREEDGQAGF